MRPSPGFVAAVAGGYALGRLVGSQQMRFARMAGFPIAAPSAVGWVTDFINAGYYRRAQDTREINNPRVARWTLTTRGLRRGGRRLHGHDVIDFHRAFGRR